MLQLVICAISLKAHIGIMPQDDHFPLVFRQQVKHILHAVIALLFDHFCFGALFREVEHFKNVLVIAVFDGRGAFYLAEMVNAEVVPDTHGPGKEFTFIGIPAAANGINNPDKNILKNIFGKILVFNQEEYGGIDLVLWRNTNTSRAFTFPEMNELISSLSDSLVNEVINSYSLSCIRVRNTGR
jgi:hypothetical protein